MADVRVRLREMPAGAADEIRRLRRQERVISRLVRALEAAEAAGVDGGFLRCPGCPLPAPERAAPGTTERKGPRAIKPAA